MNLVVVCPVLPAISARPSRHPVPAAPRPALPLRLPSPGLRIVELETAVPLVPAEPASLLLRSREGTPEVNANTFEIKLLALQHSKNPATAGQQTWRTPPNPETSGAVAVVGTCAVAVVVGPWPVLALLLRLLDQGRSRCVPSGRRAVLLSLSQQQPHVSQHHVFREAREG